LIFILRAPRKRTFAIAVIIHPSPFSTTLKKLRESAVTTARSESQPITTTSGLSAQWFSQRAAFGSPQSIPSAKEDDVPAEISGAENIFALTGARTIAI
jgi:hypothetical protein